MAVDIMLASASPRRRDLLESVGVRFTVQAAEVDETPLPGESAQSMACRLSLLKARTVAAHANGKAVLAADTVVVLQPEDKEETILGKPQDAGSAIRMLEQLSGRTHFVWTAFSIIAPGSGQELTRSVATSVTFRRLSAEEIFEYVRTGEPLDKAGAYGAQGIGAFAISHVAGSYTNVVGLPLAEVLDELAALGLWEPADLNRRTNEQSS